MVKNSISGSIEEWITDISIGISKRFNNDTTKGEEFIDLMVDGTVAFNNEVMSRGWDFKSCGVILTIMLTREELNKLFDLIPLNKGPMENYYTIGVINLEYNVKKNEWKSDNRSYPRVFVIESFECLANICQELHDDSFKDEIELTPTSHTIEAGYKMLELIHKYHGFWQLIRGMIRGIIPIEYAVNDLVKLGYLKYKRGN